MYEELVKSLRTDHDKYFARDMEAADAINEMSSAIDNLNYLLSKPQWISVKDRLPKNQNPVLVYVPPYNSNEDDFIGYVGMAYYTSLGDGWWAGSDGAVYGAIGIIHTPTHWMPLPQPPKEET